MSPQGLAVRYHSSLEPQKQCNQIRPVDTQSVSSRLAQIFQGPALARRPTIFHDMRKMFLFDRQNIKKGNIHGAILTPCEQG